jgi:hypothetical protein
VTDCAILAILRHRLSCNYTSIVLLGLEVHAYEVHAYEVHAHKLHAHEVYAYEVYIDYLIRKDASLEMTRKRSWIDYYGAY